MRLRLKKEKKPKRSKKPKKPKKQKQPKPRSTNQAGGDLLLELNELRLFKMQVMHERELAHRKVMEAIERGRRGTHELEA